MALFRFLSNYVNISKIAFRLEVKGERLKAGTLSLSLLTHEVLISLRSNDYFVGTPIIEPKFVERYNNFYRADARINTILLNATPHYSIYKLKIIMI